MKWAGPQPKLPLPYPLAWPDGWKRTEPRLRGSALYRMTSARAAEELVREVENWPIVDRAYRDPLTAKLRRAYVITSNVQRTWSDGRPFASERVREPRGDPAVALWWLERGGALRVVACDTWNSVAANMRAVGVVIESLRAIERAGATQAGARASFSFAAHQLPGGAGDSGDGTYAQPAPDEAPWWALRLGLERPYTEAAIVRAWRACVVREHPDRGGSHEAFLELERARDEALAFARTEARRAG